MQEEKRPCISKWSRLQIRARRAFNRIPLQDQQKIYVLTLLIGVVCGLAAVLFHLLLDYFQAQFIYRAAAVPNWWRIPLMLLLPAAGGIIAGAGLYFYVPEARGSGIPQVKTAFYLDGGRIKARVIPAKMVLSALNIGSGASLGREGPSVQICAAIASLFGRIFAISRRNLQNLIPVGAAAGLAAAFNTPIAAVTFTLEEILANSGGRPLGSIVIAAVIAAVIEHSILGDSALFNAPAYRLHSATSQNLVHAHPDHTLDTAVIKLARRRVSQLPVVSRKDTAHLLGIITMHDIADALGKDQPHTTT